MLQQGLAKTTTQTSTYKRTNPPATTLKSYLVWELWRLQAETNWIHFNLCSEPPFPFFYPFSILQPPTAEAYRHTDILSLLCEHYFHPLVIFSTVFLTIALWWILFFFFVAAVVLLLRSTTAAQWVSQHNIILLFYVMLKWFTVCCFPIFIFLQFLKCSQVLLKAFPAEPWQLLAIR